MFGFPFIGVIAPYDGKDAKIRSFKEVVTNEINIKNIALAMLKKEQLRTEAKVLPNVVKPFRIEPKAIELEVVGNADPK